MISLHKYDFVPNFVIYFWTEDSLIKEMTLIVPVCDVNCKMYHFLFLDEFRHRIYAMVILVSGCVAQYYLFLT